MMERDNRKSHLAPQLSPSTQDLLRSSDSPTHNNGSEERKSPTPTSGEIPIGGAGLVTPRDYANGNGRSPSRNGYSNTAKAPVSAHPGLGPRYPSESGQVPSGYADTRGPVSANAATFSLPVRPAPPSGPLPPAPARRNTPDTMPRENRRQATFGLPPNPSSGYGV